MSRKEASQTIGLDPVLELEGIDLEDTAFGVARKLFRWAAGEESESNEIKKFGKNMDEEIKIYFVSW